MAENWQKDTKEKEQIKLGSPSLEWTSGLQMRLELARKYVDFKGKKVLDVGCGVGMFLREFTKLESEVFGIDIDEKKISIAGKEFENVELAPSEKIPFRKNIFDVVWLHEVIEHVDDDTETVRECLRVLKPGGKLVVFAPNKLWPFETHGIYIGKKYKFGNIPIVTYLPSSIYEKLVPHVRNYRKKDLYALLKGSSYKKVHYQGVFPAFDKLASKIPLFGTMIQVFFRLINKTPFNRFGISHFLIVEKL